MSGSNVAIIIPTYNESENVDHLLKKIFNVYPKANVFIVDDSSDEEHEKIKHASKNHSVNLLKRKEKLGRGSAVIDGFKLALKNKDTEYFFEMDADLSHDPSELPVFVNKMKETGAGLVIGSRYIEKGLITNWPKRRLFLSKSANVFLNILLGLNLTEYTNGYRLFSRDAVKILVKHNHITIGFISNSEKTFLLKKRGHMIAEVPSKFTDRIYGESTFKSENFIKSISDILKIRFTIK